MGDRASAWGVVVIAHGSRQPRANQDLFDLVDSLRLLGFSHVAGGFLEIAEPTIVQAGDACIAAGAERLVLVPYFLSAGIHAVEDLRRARDELIRRHRGVEVRLARALGPHPLLETIVRERIDEATSEPPG